MNISELQKIKQRYNIVGNAPALNRALDVALQVAPTDLSVLIVGESGVDPQDVEKNTLPLTAGQYPKELLTANCLDMRKAHIQAPSVTAKAILAWLTKVQSSSTKWENFH